MISQTWTHDKLASALVPRSNWHPFPTSAEREPWDALPAHIRDGARLKGEAALRHQWPALPATLFLEFARNGNRRNYENVSFGRRYSLRDLVLAECVEGEGRFLDDIVNGIWAICEESFWGIPACMYMQEHGSGLPDVDEPVVPLFVAETISLLAWTVYLIGPRIDGVSPLVIPRIKRESQKRVLGPLLDRDNFWWMGLENRVHPITGKHRRVNNWNPWICSNWMTAALILEDDPDLRSQHVHKAVRCLDEFVDPYPRDGGCDEGPSYWGRAGASLFDCLELLHSATGGAMDFYSESIVQEIGRFVYRAQISDRYFTNFADASAIVLPSATIAYLYGKRICDRNMMDLGSWAAHFRLSDNPKGEDWSVENLSRGLPDIFTAAEILEHEPRQPLPRDVWLPDIQFCISRDNDGSADGLFFAAKGGHNEESHNHNDVGTFCVYSDGKPLLVDAGVETYTAKTFGPNRYDIWTMQTAYHNLPTFNGVQQEPGEEFCATDVSYASDDTSTSLSLRIDSAYPGTSGLEEWRRQATHLRGDSVTVEDTYQFESAPQDLQWHLLTPSNVDQPEPGTIHLTQANIVDDMVSAEGWIQFDPDAVDVTHEEIEINDERMSKFWGNRLVRINLTARHAEARGTFAIRVTKKR